MNAPEIQRLEELFHAAADLAAGERDAFLERECEGAPELRRSSRSVRWPY